MSINKGRIAFLAKVIVWCWCYWSDATLWLELYYFAVCLFLVICVYIFLFVSILFIFCLYVLFVCFVSLCEFIKEKLLPLALSAMIFYLNTDLQSTEMSIVYRYLWKNVNQAQFFLSYGELHGYIVKVKPD